MVLKFAYLAGPCTRAQPACAMFFQSPCAGPVEDFGKLCRRYFEEVIRVQGAGFRVLCVCGLLFHKIS